MTRKAGGLFRNGYSGFAVAEFSVLIVHHAGKGGQQRGTSRREDVLDTSISLRHPEDYVPTGRVPGLKCISRKARGIHGEDAKPFEAKMEECKALNCCGPCGKSPM